MRLLSFLFASVVVAFGQGSPDIVISQIYGGGGNSGAQLRSDFIELFNRGSVPVNVGGWSVQYASATGTEWQVTPLQGTIQPGRYLLVKQADGANASATALPTPDVTGTTPMSATSAKVALVRDVNAISGTRPTSNIIDLVGYGEANGFEGNGPARVLSNTTAAQRRGNGCVDTDDNANDFQTGVPSPRNSASEAVNCNAVPEARRATIAQIQGSGAISPLVGQSVITQGIVTGVGTNGFWMQSTPGDDDGNPATSDGIFVFTSTRPAANVTRAVLVQVSGTVQEFRPASDPGSPTLTEIAEPAVTVLAQNQQLALPVKLTTGLDLERYEGMRVSIDELRTVSGTLGSINEPSATTTSTGVFFGVFPGAASPYRTPDESETFEAIRVDTRAQGSNALDVKTGDLVRSLVGPLDYAFRTYTVVQDPAPVVVFTPDLSRRSTVFQPGTAQFTIAAANLQRLFDDQDDPSTSDPIVNAAAVEARVQRIGTTIREALQSPDVIAVEEVENLPLLQRVAAAVGMYDANLLEGNDVGGIDVGLLTKRGRVNVLNVTQEGKDAGPANDRLWDRPPLVAKLEIGSVPFTAIVVHLRSLINADTATVAAKRRAQAEALRDIVSARAAMGEQVIVLGDFNMWQFDPLVDVIRQKTPLTNLTDTLPVSEGYTYIENGVRQTLDHMLVTEGLKMRLYRYEVAHINADAPATNRISDHDFPVATFSFDPGGQQFTPAGVTNAANFLSGSIAPGEIATIFGRNLSGAQVLVNGSPAQVLSSIPSQLSFIVPANVQGPTATLQAGPSNIISLPVAETAPAIFGVGGGQGAILNQDSSLNSATNPATRGSILQIFGTGAVSPVAVRIGGQTSDIQYAGPAPGLPGVVQVNARVPDTVPPGTARIVLSSGGRTGDLNTFVQVR